MVKRKIITIDEKLCNGCGVCIPNCPEGAIQIIDGKTRLISDIFCDGLGACIGNCPQGAITTVEREAAPYDEKKTMRENIIKAGENTIRAHLQHLKDHGETTYFKEALEVLKEEGITINIDEKPETQKDTLPCGCPGTALKDFSNEGTCSQEETGARLSQLQQWPVQLHLLPPTASFFKNADVLLAADCTAFTVGDFHKDYLKGKRLAIACPKLDSNLENYVEKLRLLIDEATINTLTVVTMEVPCCSGLLQMAKQAAEQASRNIPIKSIIISIKGAVVKEEWI